MKNERETGYNQNEEFHKERARKLLEQLTTENERLLCVNEELKDYRRNHAKNLIEVTEKLLAAEEQIKALKTALKTIL